MAEVTNRDVGSSFTGEKGVTKAELGNKEEAAGTGMVKAAAPCTDFATCGGTTKPAAAGSDDSEPKGQERKKAAEPEQVVSAAILKEKVPQSFIDRIKTRPIPRPSPIPERWLSNEVVMASFARINAMVDVEEDCLRQHAEKGYAEVGVDFTDGVKTIFLLAN